MVYFGKLVLVAVIAYLLGSLNFGVIVSKALLGFDLRTKGSGNAGATNAYRVMGPKKALLVLLGDVLKGVIAILVGNWLCGDDGRLVAMIATVVGHVFPLYFGFKGGKGVLTAGAMIAVFDWRIFLVIFGAFLLVVICTRYVSAGSMTAAALFPVMMLLLYWGRWQFFAVGLVLGGAVIYLHRSNIKRLLAGTESKFTFKRPNAKRGDQ